ncbi:MAG: CopG family transcriptional regulator [Deltaproteobacteria bacterium]|nr:CopG family transcriptional regulator [Deltaproteobacteria bacterium]
MIGFRVTKEFKKFLEELADSENRTLSSFLLNAILYYIKEEKGIDYKKDQKPPKQSSQ